MYAHLLHLLYIIFMWRKRIWVGADDDDVGADDLYLAREEDEGQSSTKANHHYLAERNLSSSQTLIISEL